jgi:hypothetical protein
MGTGLGSVDNGSSSEICEGYAPTCIDPIPIALQPMSIGLLAFVYMYLFNLIHPVIPEKKQHGHTDSRTQRSLYKQSSAHIRHKEMGWREVLIDILAISRSSMACSAENQNAEKGTSCIVLYGVVCMGISRYESVKLDLLGSLST